MSGLFLWSQNVAFGPTHGRHLWLQSLCIYIVLESAFPAIHIPHMTTVI